MEPFITRCSVVQMSVKNYEKNSQVCKAMGATGGHCLLLLKLYDWSPQTAARKLVSDVRPRPLIINRQKTWRESVLSLSIFYLVDMPCGHMITERGGFMLLEHNVVMSNVCLFLLQSWMNDLQINRKLSSREARMQWPECRWPRETKGT